ncbi:unnamed protein product [Brachionus calyciflorus]|uniref:non-specific serine/threonine protein kinase n=1 Tax=Brachionus calyciflorus TaxID=104777 RepID=A0A813PAF2_9BILA|nr:unnamed protein product [Brachionus calyciflorus]
MYLTPKLFQIPSIQTVSKSTDLPSTNLHSTQPLSTLSSSSNQNYYLPKIKQFPLANNNGLSLNNSVNNHSSRKVQLGGSRLNASLPGVSETGAKPRIVTIIRATERPRKKITILLNRKALYSFEQFVCDISDAFGLPQWKNDKIRKLYTLKGKRVQAISDFFRDDDIFIGVSGKEPLKGHLIVDLLQEIYPDNEEYAQNLFKDWETSRSKSRSTKPRHSSLDHHKDNLSSNKKENAYNTDGEVSTSDKKTNYTVEFDENGRRKKKKKVSDSDPALDMELQRQRERLKLIEIERKKRESNTNKENNNTTSTTNSKRVNILSPINNPEIVVEKKPKRKIKFKPNPIPESSIEPNQNDIVLKKSPSAMSVKENDDRKQVKSKSPTSVGSNFKEDLKEPILTPRKKDHEHKELILKTPRKEKTPIKLKRQITNFNRILDRYEIIKTLGDGNFAVVKQAKLKNTDHEYAIKIIDKSKMKGKENMIENEIHIMKSCNHPNIVKLHEEFETKDEVYLITDLVKGGDLFDAISQSVKFNERDSACMIQDICEALFYLHSKNIVHRDLKPENLLVMRKKDDRISIKLADFGLAMEVKDAIYTVCGTPTYVAPEILSEIGYGLEVDMWACGVITYILLCGFPPFRSLDRNQDELFQYIQAGEFEFLMPYWEGISESSKDLINHLLVVDKKKRWKAVDVLCHPWIITQGNSKPLPPKFDKFKEEYLKELADKAKIYAAEPFAPK